MILFTCVISSLVTERSARRFALDENVQAEEEVRGITIIYDVLYLMHKLCDKVTATRCIVNHIWQNLTIFTR